MKNNYSIWFICSLLNVITAIIYFTTGHQKALGVLWLSIAVVNLTTGLVYRFNLRKKNKKENEEDAADDKKVIDE